MTLSKPMIIPLSRFSFILRKANYQSNIYSSLAHFTTLLQNCRSFQIQTSLIADKSILFQLEKCKNMTQFNQIHGLIITTGMFHNVFTASRLVVISSFSLDPPNIPLACLLLSQIQSPDVYTYNSIIKATSRASNPCNSLYFYSKMLHQDLQPNEYTFCFLFTSCAHGLALHEGNQIHSHFVKHGLNIGVFATTSLLFMYGECGDIPNANRVFDEMLHRTAVSWGAMIDAYISHGFLVNGLRLFLEMRNLRFEVSNATLVSVLCACAKLQDLVLGRMVHGYVEIKGMELNLTLGTSLVYMYSKCGAVGTAMDVFSVLPAKSVATWNCMINGLAMNGRGNAAIGLFRDMQKGVKPNSATLIGVLHSCSHAGLVEDGVSYFQHMSDDYGVTPNVKHYGCMVDLYGRAGQFDMALEVIRTMPMNPDVVVWGALLGACRTHGHARLGELVGAQIMKLQPHQISGCMGLSGVYAMAGRWDDVVGVRTMMMNMETMKEAGLSMISA